MKKIIIILGIVCISASAIAQRAVRIGNMEIMVRMQDQDTTMQVNILDDPCPPCPPDNVTGQRTQSTFRRYSYSSAFGGLGFILPDNYSGYYSILGGNSFNFDFGSMRRYQLTRRFALVGTLHYSFYNYRLHDALEDAEFQNVILNGIDYTDTDIRKQVYRSHNAAAGAFTRFYLVQPRRHSNKGFFIDLGVQGDWAFSKYYKLKISSQSNVKERDGHTFNPFNASYVARIGLSRFTVFARYRFTDVFNSKELQKGLPPLTIGVNFL